MESARVEYRAVVNVIVEADTMKEAEEKAVEEADDGRWGTVTVYGMTLNQHETLHIERPCPCGGRDSSIRIREAVQVQGTEILQHDLSGAAKAQAGRLTQQGREGA